MSPARERGKRKVGGWEGREGGGEVEEEGREEEGKIGRGGGEDREGGRDRWRGRIGGGRREG
jgi:hypothetical protein